MKMQIFRDIIKINWFDYLFNCLEDYSWSLGFFVSPRDLLTQILFTALLSCKKLILNIYLNYNSSSFWTWVLTRKCERLRVPMLHWNLKIRLITSVARNGIVIIEESVFPWEFFIWEQNQEMQKWRLGATQKWCLLWSLTLSKSIKYLVTSSIFVTCHLPSQLNAPHPYAGQYSLYVGIHAI